MHERPVRLPDWLKIALSIVVPLLIALWAIGTYVLPDKINTQTSSMASDISSLKTDVANAKGDITRIDGNVNGLLKELVDAQLASVKRLKNQSADVAKDKLGSVSTMLEKARLQHVRTDPKVLAEAGKDSLELAANPELRDAASQLANSLFAYRSFLNEDSLPSTPNPQIVTDQTKYKFSLNLGPPTGTGLVFKIRLSGSAPPGEAALLDSFGNPPPPGTTSGARWILMEGQPGAPRFILDGMRMKNVVVRDVTVEYDGGATSLENVYFVDCTFDIKPAPNGRQLGSAILTMASVTYRVPTA